MQKIKHYCTKHMYKQTKIIKKTINNFYGIYKKKKKKLIANLKSQPKTKTKFAGQCFKMVKVYIVEQNYQW